MSGGLTIEKLAGEVRHLAGQVVMLHRMEMAVLHGVGQDESDLYYIARPRGWQAKPVWYSAVGHCEGLKEHLPAEMYDGIARIFEVNGPVPGAFEMKIQFEQAEPEDYDPDRHPAEMKALRARLYNEAVERARRADDEEEGACPS